MLTKQEKLEFLKDGRSSRRRKAFLKSRKLLLKDMGSLDEYISFLMSIQNIFQPFKASLKKTITSHNKL